MAFIAIMARKPRAILLQHDDIYDYSLSLISPEGERLVGYDNHWPKGHHRHVLAEEGPCSYSGIDALIADFKTDVLRVRREVS